MFLIYFFITLCLLTLFVSKKVERKKRKLLIYFYKVRVEIQYQYSIKKKN